MNFDELINEVSPEILSPILQPEEEEIVFSVAEFSNILKGTLEHTFKRIKIKGEIIGAKRHSSGTHYFDLKENIGGKDYVLNCVLWKWTRIETKIEEGLEVIITGKITAYTGRSSYQLTVENIEIAGIGTLLKIIEERKKKLELEGLFDISHKQPIPKFPKIIGVITSETGAVIQDIIHRITDRFPTRIILWNVPVQGEDANIKITEAINGFNTMETNRPDVLIIARGGGSVQDLMAFNEEDVVRATYNSTIPIISAIGHETDTTLIDYASDLRAPTPTGAAEKAVPVKSEILLNIAQYSTRVLSTTLKLFENFNLKIQSLSRGIKNPLQFISDANQRLDDKTAKLDLLVNSKITTLKNAINFSNTLLESYSFKNVLKRGYSIVWNNNEIVSNIKKLSTLEKASIEMKDGKIDISIKDSPSHILPINKVEEKEVDPQLSNNINPPKKKKTDTSQGNLF